MAFWLLAFIVFFANTPCYHSEGSWEHVIHVNGTENDSCINDTIPCVTIDMALSQLYHNSTVIYVNPGNHTLKQGKEIIGKEHIAIIGIDRNTTIIHCDSTAGLLINSSTDILIESITFSGCGYNTRININLDGPQAHVLPSSVSFNRCSNVSIISVTIKYSIGTGLLLYQVTDNVTINNCLVTGGYWERIIAESYTATIVGGIVVAIDNYYYHDVSDGLQSYSFLYLFNNSTIINNNYMYYYYYYNYECSFQSGGGITFINPVNVSIDSCHIANNSRGLFIYYSKPVYSEPGFTISNTDMLSNLYNSYILIKYDDIDNINLELIDVNMTDSLTVGSLTTADVLTDSFSQNYSTYTIVTKTNQISISLNYHTNKYYTSPYIAFERSYVELFCYRNSVGRCPFDSDQKYTGYCPLSYSKANGNGTYTCSDNHNGTLCGPCEDDYSIAVNSPHLSCVPCNDSLTVLKGWVLLIVMEFIPLTVMILIIAVVNVNLNQGSLNTFILFCQMLTIPFPSVGYPSLCVGTFNYNNRFVEFFLLPFSIWNLGFINFPSCNLISNECSPVSICISTITSPLGAISFWYLIAFYPFVLLALIYTCVSLYDRGNRCIVCVFRPVHRFLARFWRIFNIQPSLTHTIASVYTLCFTQLAAISMKILHPTFANNKRRFFYDGSKLYFHGAHGAAAILALVVLIVFIIIPTVYLTIYPFKWFQKCFNKIKFKKDLLVSVTDVFTGPYKDGTQDSWDYRYFSGIYFVIRITIMGFYCFMFSSVLVVSLEISLCGLFVIIIVIFRPYKRNIHTFIEAFFFISLSVIYGVNFVFLRPGYALLCFFTISPILSLFSSIVWCYCFIWIVKKCKFAFSYLVPARKPPSSEMNQEIAMQSPIENANDTNDSIFADRLMNPRHYDERHVSS